MSSKDISNVYKYYIMIPAIARNTIIFSWSVTFIRLMKAHKKKGP